MCLSLFANIMHEYTSRNCLASEPNYHTTKSFSENILAIEMKRTQIFISKPVYLGLSLLEIIKIVMYEFWYDYVKVKYGGKAKSCYMDAESLIFYIKKHLLRHCKSC